MTEAIDALPDLPGIDKAAGLRRLMNKPKLYEKVLCDFHARFRNETQTLRAVIDSGDLATAERMAHSAKGLAGTIGAGGLQEIARLLEFALHDSDPLWEDYFSSFEQELGQVLTGIAQGFGIVDDN
ncbi:Hpt domain-containing protein [Dechloromonas sp. ARDL1]|uniref:Hpt domain-containing protein n=1 Tax=Dechloromonas sp. ARDL1 TaxID=3322121 RepID=UPI003DA7935C